jgi:hypothetical protein
MTVIDYLRAIAGLSLLIAQESAGFDQARRLPNCVGGF